MKRAGDYLSFPLLLAAAWFLVVWNGHAWWHIASAAKPVAPPTAGCLSPAQKESLRHGVAKQSMPLNWLIEGPEVSWGGHITVSGKYVRCPLAAGDPVVDQDLRDEPLVAAGRGKVAYLLPLGGRARDLNAAMQVQLFDDSGPPVVSGAPVLAVQNGAAFLEVTPDQASVLERAKVRLRIVRQK